MQQWLLADRVRLMVGVLTLVAGYQMWQSRVVLGQQNFDPVSTLGPVIEPHDLEFESIFSSLSSSNPLRSKQQGAASSPQWVSPKTRLQLTPGLQSKLDQSGAKQPVEFSQVNPQAEIAVPNLNGPNLNGPNLNGPNQNGPNQNERAEKRPVEISRRQARLEATAKPMGRLAARQPKGIQESQPEPDFESVAPDRRVVEENRLNFKPNPARTKPPMGRQLPALTKSQQQLRTKIRRVLTYYYQHPMNTRDRSPWEILHAMLAYEVHSQVLQGGPGGKSITAVGWLCFNQPCKRRTLMYVNTGGQMRVKVGPALQGHHGQLLAMLAQSSVKKEYPIRIDQGEFTIADLVEMEKQTCYPRTELTFKLISLMHYLDSDSHWLNDQGTDWSIPRLIREEIRQPVRGAACGGTHRLGGLTLAYKTRMKRGEPVDGEYLQAKKFVQNYQRYAYRLQNSDGSFSTEWFRGRGNEEDIDRRLKTTGHILEWLLYASTEKELHNWRTTRAANYLANIMYKNRNRDWEAGPLGHAIHALLLYDRKVFGKYDQWNSQQLASKPSRPQAKRSSQTRRRRK